MDCSEAAKCIWWLGETVGFWIQTGAIFLSAIAAIYVIYHNGKLAKQRALIDLIIQQKADENLIAATRRVYDLQDSGNHLSSLVGTDSDDRKLVLKVINNQEFIAVGIRLGAFDEKVYKQLQFNNVNKLWSATSGFIHEIRKIDQKLTLFQDFECLAVRWSKTPIKRL
jgi:anti-sigma-K factor RskA